MTHSNTLISGFKKKYSPVLFIIWTAVIVGSWLYNDQHHRIGTLKEAEVQARAYYELNLAYRVLLSEVGGVYVPVSKMAPNPYLNVPHREIPGPDNTQLTLLNPAYMTRLVFQILHDRFKQSVHNRLTSLKYLNPVNAPDEWERKALMSFDKGQKEAHEVTTIEGKPYLRLMRPFVTEEGCLKCHGHQGYKVGDVRGGISIAVPLETYYAFEAETARALTLAHFFIWTIGCIGLIIYSRKRYEQEDRIRQSLKEKEALLREIHHRVKNNMAIISSLLSLQARNIKDPVARKLMEESRQRIKSMALVHEKLYHARDLAAINFKDYINSIISEIRSIYRTNASSITTDLRIEDVELDLDLAVPCGLIINELLTNAYKHAFPDNKSGLLSVYFSKTGDTYTLTIRDNGVGLPEGFDYKETNTLGLQLVNALTGQLKGTLQIKSDKGVEAVVAFPQRRA